MKDPRLIKLSELLVNYCVEVKPGDKVLLRGTVPGLPLITETYRQILHAGGLPFVILEDEAFAEILLNEGNDDQIQAIPAPARLLLETYDRLITINGTANTRSLSGVDPARQKLLQSAQGLLRNIVMERVAAGAFRGVVTLYPTAAQAQEADMSLSDFEDFVYGACHADKPDPVTIWRSVSAKQQALIDWLAEREQVTVKGTNIDLGFSIKDRTFVNGDGRVNMPCGELFTGPVEESVNGWVRFTYPAIMGGREVYGIELVFEDGKVVQATAEKNEPFLLQMLETDLGAKYLGEFAIGTNEGIQRFTKSILFDEKIAGTVHMALGTGYPQTGSKNVSAIHWDMICDMRDGGEILVDGELFYRSGAFLI